AEGREPTAGRDLDAREGCHQRAGSRARPPADRRHRPRNPRDGPLLGEPAGDLRPARCRPAHEPSADPGASTAGPPRMGRAFGRPLLTLVYAPEYAAHEVVLIWLAVATGVGFLAQALGYAVTAARRLPEQLPIALLSLVVCTVGSYLLVPRYGLVGAAWAVLA